MSSLYSHIGARQAPPPPSRPEKDIPDHTAQLLGVVGSLYGLALLAVLLRVYVRARVLRAFGTSVIRIPCSDQSFRLTNIAGLDDWLMTVAMVIPAP